MGRGGINGAGSTTVEGVADDTITQLSEWAGIPDLAERIVVRRTVGPADFSEDLNSWRGGALGPAHTLKQSAFLRGSNVSKKVDGLYYAGGTTIPGIGLPMCLISAEILLKRVQSDLSTGPLKEPLEPVAAPPGRQAGRPNGSGTGIRSQVASWIRRVVRAASGSTGTPASAASCATPDAA